MSEKKSTTSSRFRNFVTVVYPESAPDGWLSILADQCIPCFVSPLHGSDLDPTGEKKKPHYHVLFTFEGKKSLEQVQSVCSLIGGVGCLVVQSLRAMARYLCHLDNPDKAQYSPDDVLSFGGADYYTAINLPTDKYKIIKEMMDYCNLTRTYAFSELLLYASEYKFQWFRILCDSGTIVMKEYLKSLSWAHSRGHNV